MSHRAVHHHYLLILGVFLVGIIIGVLAVNVWNTDKIQQEDTGSTVNLNQEDEPQQNVNESTTQAAEQIEEYGFWIPAMENDVVVITESNLGKEYTFDTVDSENIVIEASSSEELPVGSDGIGQSATETLERDGASIQDISGTSAKDGSKMRYVYVEHEEKQYIFKGTDEFLDDVVQRIEFSL